MMIWGGKVTDKTDEIFRKETVSLIPIQTIIICLYAEFAMAVVTLVSGIMILRKMPFARETNIGGLGMVVHFGEKTRQR